MKLYLFIAYIMLFLSCSRISVKESRTNLLEPSNYISYFNNASNGLSHIVDTAGNIFTCQYKTPELETLLSSNSNVTSPDFLQDLNAKKGLLYFTLLVEHKNYSQEKRDALSRYLSYIPLNAIKLCQNKDTLNLLDAHYVSPVLTFQPHKLLLIFKDPGVVGNFTVKFKTNLKDTEAVSFSFSGTSLQNIPSLKIQG